MGQISGVGQKEKDEKNVGEFSTFGDIDPIWEAMLRLKIGEKRRAVNEYSVLIIVR